MLQPNERGLEFVKGIFPALIFMLVTVPVSSQGEPGVNVDLGVMVDTFAPGDPVEIPVTLVTRNDPLVGSVSLEIAFPSAVLSFTAAVLGSVLEVEGAELNTELRDGEDGERKILSVEVSSTNPIGQGLLITLIFEISQEIAINHDIQLENISQSSKSLDGEDLKTRGLDGSIISIEFIPACFFYMHWARLRSCFSRNPLQPVQAPGFMFRFPGGVS